MPVLTVEESIKIANKIEKHFENLGFETSWNYYGEDIIIEIITNPMLRKLAEILDTYNPRASLTITIWNEKDVDKSSIFVGNDVHDRVFDPNEKDVNNIISKAQAIAKSRKR
tara:strand:+ start:154 stop:489 length:336 start_codon:yes stop_codon:yes gene_type:complete